VATRLFVGSLSYKTTDAVLEEFFASIGKVVSARVIVDHETGRSKGFGFVEMATEAEARAAIEQLNGKELEGRALIVNEAHPQVRRENRDYNRDNAGVGSRW
jgi:RNA recognition motif-containing protein